MYGLCGANLSLSPQAGWRLYSLPVGYGADFTFLPQAGWRLYSLPVGYGADFTFSPQAGWAALLVAGRLWCRLHVFASSRLGSSFCLRPKGSKMRFSLTTVRH